MDTDQKKYRILKMLAENEKALARLYTAYADKFPRENHFWSDLADEETAHFHLIQDIPASIDPVVEISEDRFDIEVLQTSLDYIENKLRQANDEELTSREAMSIALDIETGLLERGYFRVFEGDSAELKETLSLLAAETQNHTNKIRRKLTRKRWLFF